MKRILCLLLFLAAVSVPALAAQTITIEKGVYRLPVQPSGAHLELSGLRDVIIDFSGSTLLFESNAGIGIRLTNCENVTVKNAQLDFETPTHFQGTVCAIDPDGYYLDFYIPAGYPDVGGKNDDNILYFFDGETGDYIQEGSFHHLYVSRLETLDERKYRLYSTTVARIDGLEVGDVLTWGNRLSVGHAVKLDTSKQCRLENISIYGGQVGVFCADGYGGHTFESVRIVPGPKPLGAIEERVMSTIADGMHLQRMEHGVHINNSRIEASGDDGFNNYGAFFRVAGQASFRTAVLACSQNVRLDIGDTLRFYTESGSLVGEADITAVTRLSDRTSDLNTDRFIAAADYEVQLSATISLQPGMWVANASKNCSDFSITNTTYKNLHGRGILIKGSNGRVENCTFDNVGIAGILITPEFGILESDYVHDIVVRNNTFIGCGLRGAAIRVTGQEGWDHERLTFIGNTFIGSPHYDLSVTHTTDLTITDNRAPTVYLDKVDTATVQSDAALTMTEDTNNIQKV